MKKAEPTVWVKKRKTYKYFIASQIKNGDSIHAYMYEESIASENGDAICESSKCLISY